MQHSKRSLVLKIAALVLAVLLVAGCASAYYFYSQIADAFDEGDAGTLNQQTDPDIESGGDRFYNLLIMGIDYDADDEGRDYSNGKGMTDVLLYLQIDRVNYTINALQIPRDTYAGEDIGEGISTHTGKINEVFANGPDQTNKINNIANKLYQLFKLPVDDYITIDMQAFKTMLNNMGGIEMYVPWDITAINPETGEEEMLVPQGQHRVSGDTAEVILRNRNYGTADYKRLETQQYFYLALFNTFKANPQDFIKVAPGFIQYFNTDMSVADLLALANTAMNLEADKIGFARAPGGPVTRTDTVTGEAQSCYGINRENMAELLNNYFRPYSDPVPAEELGLPALTDADFNLGQNYEDIRTIGSLDPGNEANSSSESVATTSDVAE